MSSAPDNFDPLLKLLSDKRKNTPPPVFFNRLSDRVIARIHKDQQAPPRPWYEKCTEDLDAKFIWAMVISAVSCCLLISGVWLAHRYFEKNTHEPAQRSPFIGQSGVTPEQIHSSISESNNASSSSLKPVVSSDPKLNDFHELKQKTGLSNIVIGPTEKN